MKNCRTARKQSDHCILIQSMIMYFVSSIPCHQSRITPWPQQHGHQTVHILARNGALIMYNLSISFLIQCKLKKIIKKLNEKLSIIYFFKIWLIYLPMNPFHKSNTLFYTLIYSRLHIISSTTKCCCKKINIA